MAGEAVLRFKIAGVCEGFILLSIRLDDMAVGIFLALTGKRRNRQVTSNKEPTKKISSKGYNKWHLKKTSSTGLKTPFL